ncbi:serine carboxypeptidase-like 27 [Actinidia rufa]|uniref:Serine carboxypeptidase-like 27 n=1 Tax=Actinidia rufa TaxID=165716 RepID=A0A7J0EG10_9ERIC|nr:serine carboxypeptidase-like 27 [Actinidia rufa]
MGTQMLFCHSLQPDIPLKALKLNTLTSWYLPGTTINKLVGGAVYKGLSRVTIRGAGHVVPLGRPQLALTSFGIS